MKPPPRTSLHQRSEPDDPSYALGIKSDDDDDNDEWDDAGGGGDDDEEDEVLSLPISVASTVESSHSKINNINARALAEQRQEEQRVFSIKLVVIIAFVIVSLGVSLAIYGLVNREENTIFETEFGNQAELLFDISGLRLQELITRLGSLGVSFAAQVDASSDVWPFATISNFETQATLFLQQQQPMVLRGPLLLSVEVKKGVRSRWEQFSVNNSPEWINESYNALNLPTEGELPTISPVIYRINVENETTYVDPGNSSAFAPFWMTSLQAVNGSVGVINYNSLDDETYSDIDQSFKLEVPPSTKYELPIVLVAPPGIEKPSFVFPIDDTQGDADWPQSIVAAAVYGSLDDKPTQVATISTRIAWHAFFQDIIQDAELEGGPIFMALEDSCGRTYMYEITGSSVVFTGAERDPFIPTSSIIPVQRRTYDFIPMTSFNCSLTVHLAASDDLYEASGTKSPVIFAVSVLAVFAAVAVIFRFYDRKAGRSYNNAINVAQQSTRQINLLPKAVRDRLGGSYHNENRHGANLANSVRDEKEGDIDDVLQRSRHRGDKAIADLHPSVTVMYADIANFTAWSSVREPAQVFQLLETLYDAFDILCVKYKIFKVDTVGDSYVAVSGIPVAVDEHAVNMARYAREMMNRMSRIVRQLEVTLGPETAELTLRIGMNSGPVTAGVLRGAKSRFQLFGETVNTASRMEGTGRGNCIQVSAATAELLKKFGREKWLIPRADLVEVKGRGEVQTYWLTTGSISADEVRPTDKNDTKALTTSPYQGLPTITTFTQKLEAVSGGSGSGRSSDNASIGLSSSGTGSEDKNERMVDWCADLLLSLLKKIVAMRESEDSYSELREFQEIVRGLDDGSTKEPSDECRSAKRRSNADADSAAASRAPFLSSPRPSAKDTRRSKTAGRGELSIVRDPQKTVLDEVAEIISLPRKTARYQQDPNKIELSIDVVRQTYRFVREVARMYRANPFHNFQHASHVTQSLTKLLSRVVAPDEVDYENMKYKKKAATAKLHKFTFGITSDPITQFACAFSSMIHDMDHPGVPNVVLVGEGTEIAKHYRNKSVAEQNSVDLAWNLLMQPQYKDLRQCIYRTQSELERFRQLVVNSVMATDIVDKELGQLRKNRWERAFNKNPDDELDEKATDEVNRKATIVIEHLIQAADVAHTMQHWHVYLKWNERFFDECYAVYKSGRSATDPSENWYKGEIGFFDFYIIPLAKKLESCGVFGVSSDECLSYAQANRDEWERKGEEIVNGYLAKYG